MQFSLLEAAVFNLLRSIPLIFLAFYPFVDRKRFSAKITTLIYELILAIWMITSLYNAYFAPSTYYIVVAELIGFILIAVLYVAALDAHPGKMLFFCFMLINVGYMTTASAKCLEGFLFPQMALERYRWTASLCLLLVSIVIELPVYRFMKWEKDNLSRDMQPGYVWQFSWLVPTTFYLIWAHEFYGTGNALEWVLKPSNVFFLGIVNLASFLIYYLILRLIRESADYLRLREENHALTLQIMQYDDLNQRISAARQGRHDLRHHIVTMENYVKAGNIEELKKYLDEIGERYQLAETLTYCSNTTVNGILSYFSQEASRDNIDYKVNLGIPEEVKIAKTDLSILFGHLLENALEACQRQRSGERKIHVRGQTSQNTFALAIDNTYETEPQRDKMGKFRSMKHAGAGIGTESVRDIVSRYDGVIEFETKGDLFCVSVLLYLS